jgi:VanZ family protein
MIERAPQALRIAAILFLLSLVIFAKFHEPTRFVHTLQKLAHPVTFGAVALLFLTLLRRHAPRRVGTYLAALVLTVLCGALTEVAQGFVNRDPSLLDVLRDALGASTALAGFAALFPGSDARGQGRWRVISTVIAFVGISIMLTPISISLAAYAHRDLRFPVLLEGCSPLDRYFLVGSGAAAIRIVPSTGSTTSSCGRALRVDFGTAQYGGTMLEEPYPDWRSANILIIDLHNPGDFDLPLAVRVHDRAHNFQYLDRFNRDFSLRAHERLEIAIPMGDIEHAPAGRMMDLSRVAGVAVFRDRGTMAGSFEIERILLRR